jgi:hypothetical protein
MRRRLAVLLLLLLPALAAGTNAKPGTRFAPVLRAEQGRFEPRTGAGLVLDVSQPPTEPAMSRVTFVAPAGVVFSPSPTGLRVGDMAAELVPTAGAARAPVILSGHLLATAASRAGGCVRGARATLSARLASSGTREPRRLSLVVVVHARDGTTRLTVCLPRVQTLPKRSAVRRLVMRMDKGVPAPPPGAAVWRGLFTPAGPRGGPAPRKLTTESRAVVIIPSFMTLERRGAGQTVRRGSLVTLSGTLTIGSPQAGRKVRLQAGSGAGSLSTVARATTARGGRFVFRVRAVKSGRVVFQARAPSRKATGGCRVKKPDAPAGCTSATTAGVSSNAVVVTVR